MKFLLPSTLLFSLFLASSLSAARAQQETQAPKQENADHQTAPLKAIRIEMVPYPAEALKKRIQGKVKLRIVVDAKGNVSEVKALSGPKALFEAAIASVKQWQYEPPLSPPAVETVEVSYGFPRKCPGAISDTGGVETRGALFNKRGKMIAAPDGDDYPLPPYPDEERKAGVAGKMVLAISLNPDGRVKGARIVKSLSPGLDKAAIDTVRTWKFKLIDPNAKIPLGELQLGFVFEATCNPNF